MVEVLYTTYFNYIKKKRNKMVDNLVNNILLLQILTIISATITILLEIYFIIKNIKKKY